ncbi:PLP-dependent transferase [Sarocladium strictum]
MVQVTSSLTEPGVSKRATLAASRGSIWDLMMQVKSIPKYDPVKCPDGLINLSGAENSLMEDWNTKFLESLAPLDTSQAFSYGALHGSPSLLAAAADFFTTFFDVEYPVDAREILVSGGVTALFDLVAWAICEPGDAVLTLTPKFFMLDVDLALRSDVTAIAVPTDEVADAFGGNEASCAQLVALLESALADAVGEGSSRCKALFICNPTNPQGRCYSRLALETMAAWCAQHQLYLVSDEIYALSNHAHSASREGVVNLSSNGIPAATALPSSFCSILDIAKPTEPHSQNIICLYSLSKDFGMGGLRLGFLVTRNVRFLKAIASATWFTWVTAFSDHVGTKLLEDQQHICTYLTEYRRRLTEAYAHVAQALQSSRIPYEPAEAGLFVFIDLHAWLKHFKEGDNDSSTQTPERRFCTWLIQRGVFLNPGEEAGALKGGKFRLVFTADVAKVELAIKRLRAALDTLDALGVDA